MSRNTLHELVDRIPDNEVQTAQRYLEFLSMHLAVRTTRLAPVDDEPVTEGDADAIRRALADVENNRVSAHEDILREFGLR